MNSVRTFAYTCLATLALLPLSLHAQITLTNGDFENGFTGWSNLANNGAVASYALETTDPYAGSNSMKVTVTSLSGVNEWDVQSMGPTPAPALTTNDTYTLIFYAKADAANTQTKIVLQNTLFDTKSFVLTQNWERCVWTFSAKEGSPQLKIRHTNVGTTYFDNFSIIAGVPAANLTLSPETQHQTMVGIGGALTWYAHRVISSPNRSTIENLIFDDLGLDIIRLKSWYYPDNYPTNKDATNMSDWSDRQSFAANPEFHTLAKANGRDIKILYSCWSPPDYLKESGLRKGIVDDAVAGTVDNSDVNTLKKDAQGNFMYNELAQYWVDAFDNISFMPDYLSFQNEPGWHAKHETCLWGDPDTDGYPSYAVASNLIHESIKDLPNSPTMIGPESENMNHLLNEATVIQSHDYVGAYAYHSYNVYSESLIDDSSTISKLNSIRDSFGDKPSWMTELSRTTHSWLDTGRLMHNHFVEANASAYIYWSLVWDETQTDCMIGIDSSGNYIVKPHYYTVKHFAKYIDEGYKRFEISGSTSSTRMSGFISPDGKSLTLIAINSDTQANDLDISHSNLPITSSVAYQTSAANIASSPFQSLGAVDLSQTQTLPAESITTYVVTLSNTANPIDPDLFTPINTSHNGTAFATSIRSQLGFQYSLWKSPDLSAGSWTEVTGAAQTTTNGVITFTDNSPVSGTQFYRIQAQ